MRYPEATRLGPVLPGGHVIDTTQAVFGMLRSALYRRWVEIGEGTHSAFMEKNRWQVFNAVDGFLGERPNNRERQPVPRVGSLCDAADRKVVCDLHRGIDYRSLDQLGPF